MKSPIKPLWAVIPAAALLLAACSSSSTDTASSGGTGSGTGDCPAVTTKVEDVTVEGVTVSGELGKEPKVTIADTAKPAKELVVKDIVVGNCRTVQKDQWVVANYAGYGLNTKKEFDSSFKRGEPIGFSLKGVIPGWQEGIPGQREGGRRILIIPGDKAYGATPPEGAGIEANETLVFVVDMVGTTPSSVK